MPTLNWLTRDEDLKAAANVEYRLLVEDEKYSYPPPPPVNSDQITDNIIVQGDNLEALKALLPFYAGQVKCIYIDPPYNTGSRINADGNDVGYDDNLEHSIWLAMMYPRLELLKKLLKEDGSIWISIDEKECHYLKIICDEIFGRENFIIQTTIQRGSVSGHKAINPTPVQVTDLMLTYAKKKDKWNYKPVFIKRDYDKAYSKFIINFEEDYTEWKFITLKEAIKIKNITLDECLYNFADRIIRFAQPNYEGVGQNIRKLIDKSKKESRKIFRLQRDNHPDFYLLKGNRILFYKDKLKMIDGNYITAELATNLWLDMNYQGIANEGEVKFAKGKKPEIQIKRIFDMSTNPGDIVLDSFLGSGTTAAVAHKMGRRYIGVEMGEHAKTHCAVRLKKVIDGEQGGISKSVDWKGGGGFRFFTLGEAVFDSDRRIKSDILFENLAAHIYFTETKTPMKKPKKKSAFLGVHNGTAYALLYNGILGDKSIDGGNVLTHRTLNLIRNEMDTAAKKNKAELEYSQIVIYGEATRLTYVSLVNNNIIFKQTPYDIKVW